MTAWREPCVSAATAALWASVTFTAANPQGTLLPVAPVPGWDALMTSPRYVQALGLVP